jgi:predicted esterase
MFGLIHILITKVVNFVFLGSKSILSSKNKPFVCGVHDFEVLDFNLQARLFYPSKRSALSAGSQGASWFIQPIADVVYGKLVFWLKPETRSRLVQFLCSLAYYICSLIPVAVLPTIPNSMLAKVPEVATHNGPLPLVVWSHGRGGNIHDHSLLLSQLAVEVPCICLTLTHTDGSADSWLNARKRAAYYHRPKSSGQDERFLKELVEMQEYQVLYRIHEIEQAINQLKLYGIEFGRLIVGGFDLGGATALACAARLNAAGAISLDGMFAIEDRFRFPRDVFNDSPSVPSAFILSDEWQVWNRSVVENTKFLSDRSQHSKLITVKQTKHNNFIECMYWIPQVFLILLRFSGLIHRRACPRKTYRRTTKWLVALVQQYMTDDPARLRSYSS